MSVNPSLLLLFCLPVRLSVFQCTSEGRPVYTPVRAEVSTEVGYFQSFQSFIITPNCFFLQYFCLFSYCVQPKFVQTTIIALPSKQVMNPTNQPCKQATNHPVTSPANVTPLMCRSHSFVFNHWNVQQMPLANTSQRYILSGPFYKLKVSKTFQSSRFYKIKFS